MENETSNIGIDESESKKKHWLFKPGNKAGGGRKKGSRNAVTVVMEELLHNYSSSLMKKAIDMALEGDSGQMKLCLERLYPPPKDKPILVDLPKMTNIEDITKGMERVVDAVSEGEITPSEGMSVAGVIEFYRKTIETNEVINRLNDIEHQMKERGI